MAKPDATWKVLRHGPLTRLSEGLWTVCGDLEGMPLKRVMTVARRAGGGLVIHNAMALGEADMAALDALGPVREIVVPNGFHRLDAPAYAARYPEARFFAPAGARVKVEEAVTVHGGCEDLPVDDVVSYTTLEGAGAREGLLRVVSEGEVTLVFNDVFFNMPHMPGAKGFVLRHVTQSTGGPKITRISRLFLVKDKVALAAHLTRLAETLGLRRLVVSHHEPIDVEPADTLRRLARSL